MTTFFWVAQIANAITTVVALAALLIVLWLGPRRWTNLSFACLLAAIIVWMGFSFVARLLVNVPQLGGDPAALMNWVALGFALLGITLFWFVESFYPIGRRWRLAANLLGVVIYGLFLVLLFLGGMAYPLDRLPDALEAIARLLPAAALAETVRGVLEPGSSVPVGELLVLLAWAVGAPLVAARYFSWED